MPLRLRSLLALIAMASSPLSAAPPLDPKEPDTVPQFPRKIFVFREYLEQEVPMWQAPPKDLAEIREGDGLERSR